MDRCIMNLRTARAAVQPGGGESRKDRGSDPAITRNAQTKSQKELSCCPMERAIAILVRKDR